MILTRGEGMSCGICSKQPHESANLAGSIDSDVIIQENVSKCFQRSPLTCSLNSSIFNGFWTACASGGCIEVSEGVVLKTFLGFSIGLLSKTVLD